jgi:hypothetical protein
VNALFGLTVCLWCTASDADGVALSGRVQLDDGTPAAKAHLWLVGPWDIWQAETDGDGVFRFSDLAVDSYLVLARFPGKAFGLWQGVLNADVEVSLTLQPDLPVHYRIVTRDVDPVANARVAIAVVNRGMTLPLERLYAHGLPPMLSGPEGYVELKGFPAGSTIEALIRHHEYAAAYVPSLQAGTHFTVHLRAGQKVSGRVTGDDGVGLAEALVSAFRLHDQRTATLCETHTDAEGFYRMRIESVEDVLVTAQADGYPASSPQALNMGGEAVNIQLARAGTVEGVVLDAEGNAVPGAMVIHRQEAWVSNQTYSGTDGRFAIAVPPGGGTIGLVVPPGNWVDGPAERVLEAEHPVDSLEPFVLRELPVLAGTVMDEDGAPVVGAMVSAEAGGMVERVLTGREGEFKLKLTQRVGDDAVSVRAEHPLRFRKADKRVSLHEPAVGMLGLAPYEPELRLETASENHEELATALSAVEWVNTAPEQAQKKLEQAEVVVLTFWSSLDPTPANRRRLALAQMLHEQFAEAPEVAVVAIHERGMDNEKLAALIQEWGISFPVAVDDQAGAAFIAFNVVSVPQSALLDGDDRIRLRDATEDALLEGIKVLRRER